VELLEDKEIDIAGLIKLSGETFRWKGEYTYELNEAITLETSLNVMTEFNPVLSEEQKDAGFLFLANIDPVLQLKVLEQMKSPELVLCDTMNYWIEKRYSELTEVVKRVDIMVLNDAEAREFTREPNLIKAGQNILEMGPERVVIKKGEHGAIMFSRDNIFFAPAYPLENIFDPTGAGDTFAGAFLGYLADVHGKAEEEYRRGVIFGSCLASFVVEEFSLNRLKKLRWDEIRERYYQFKELTHFEVR
jgi:hypothetical protein